MQDKSIAIYLKYLYVIVSVSINHKMMLKRYIFLVLGLVLMNTWQSFGEIILTPTEGISVTINDEFNDGLSISAITNGDTKYFGKIGRTIKSGFSLHLESKNIAVLKFTEPNVQLKISAIAETDRVIIAVQWSGRKNERFEDCIKLSPHQWYGGPEQKHQYWPVQKLNLSDYAYVTKEYENSAVTEPYWINSDGTFYYVDKYVPLFIDQNNKLEDHLCFIAEVREPYSQSRNRSELHYDIVLNKDAKAGHKYAVDHYLGKPSGVPDYRMIEHPIWSTWARFSRQINQSTIINFSKEIKAHKFNNSHIDIDDLWETCYGSLTIDKKSFPNFKEMVRLLKEDGFRVTLWIHPFINENCNPWHKEAKEKGYLVVAEDGNIFTSWWNNNGSHGSYVDFTNPDAKKWWIDRVIILQNEYGLDSFKFDAGESSWSPQIPVQNGDVHLHPDLIAIDYVRAVAEFGPLIEIRSARRTQDLPVFTRMLDKDTLWTFDNGLPTLVTTLLQMNMNGYPFVLPDMIGGNGYNEKPSKQLFIRWLQANTFMPSLQFSFSPWEFDSETIAISHKFAKLHADYANVIMEKMKEAVKDGTPVNAPIWWADPTDKEALAIWDEYLLGENILIAPILEENAVSRDIYLPKGVWAYGPDERYRYVGGNWFRKFSVPLDSLAYFIRVTENSI